MDFDSQRLLVPYIEGIIKFVFGKPEDEYHQKERVLIEENWCKGNPLDAVYYGPLLISSEDDPKFRKLLYPGKLAPELYPMAEDLKKRRSWLDQDKRRVSMGLAVLLAPCKNPQDIRDALPEWLAQVGMDSGGPLWGLERTRPEAWTLQGDAQKLRNHEKLLDTLAVYRMAELVS